jgi:hypothetical protein
VAISSWRIPLTRHSDTDSVLGSGRAPLIIGAGAQDAEKLPTAIVIGRASALVVATASKAAVAHWAIICCLAATSALNYRIGVQVVGWFKRNRRRIRCAMDFVIRECLERKTSESDSYKTDSFHLEFSYLRLLSKTLGRFRKIARVSS